MIFRREQVANGKFELKNEVKFLMFTVDIAQAQNN